MTPEQAFKEALILAITANSRRDSQRAVNLAEHIAHKHGFDDETVERIQDEIEREV